MYKNVIKAIGLFSLIGFSFFYSEKVITVLKEKDPIMIKLESMKEDKKISSVSAMITEDTIVPGICGKEVDVEKSYNNMKKIGMYNENYLEYVVSCDIDVLSNYYDHYIINGNKLKNKVSFVFLLDHNLSIEEITSITEKYGIAVSFFASYDYMNENISQIYQLSKKHEIYNYGKEGTYTKETLELGNNIIERVTKKESLYCLSKEKNKDVLTMCQNKKMHTIIPTVISTNLYNSVKKNLSNGQIIYIETNQSNISQLDNTISFIQKKGFQIVSLKNLLEE